MKEYLAKVSEGRHLTREEASGAMRRIMEGSSTDAQIGALLMALRVKGEQTDELLGFVDVMREKSVRVAIEDPDAIDMCGTGGDGAGTFNISTVASFVVAGAGVTVAKHGNRSISSSCGSADVLRALGVRIEIPAETAAACVNDVGIGFLFAPLFHPAMKHAARPRAELGVKTFFNLLGPLTNPAGVRRQLAGAFNREAAGKIASVFSRLDARHVFVVSSTDGLDEISLEAPTSVFEVNGSPEPSAYEIDGSSFGLPAVTRESLRGGSADDNARIALRILGGELIPQRYPVVANGAFGLLAAGKVASVQEGVEHASESIDSGRALRKLEDLREFTNR